MENKESKKKIPLILIILKKFFNLKTLIPLVVILSFNTYAWFLFTTKVETGMTAKVRAWNILIETKDDTVVESLEFNIGEIYPGMTTYSDYATVHNKGDADVSFIYEIESVTLLGTVYTVDDVTYTSEGIANMLLNDFPFVVSLKLTNDIIQPNDEESFMVEVSWPFESGNDQLDTTWGINAYEYHKNNPDLPSIKLNIKVIVDQINENES